MLDDANNIILSVKNLKLYYPSTGRHHEIKAVDDVSFHLLAGETLGIVGESGCGKTSLGRAILQLTRPTAGVVLFQDQNLVKLSEKSLRNIRKNLQIIFQDPLASLDPRMNVGQIISEPLINFYPNLSKQEIYQKVIKVMNEVGLIPEYINRYPHEFSGGQCQRIGIARALILKPKLIICDEAVSALDVSIQAQIINLLKSLQKKYNLALIFISHNLNIVKHISNRIMVMYLGKIVELSEKSNIYNKALHPYTQALLTAIPTPDPHLERNKKITILTGDLTGPDSTQTGCNFRARCPMAVDLCTKVEPKLKAVDSEQKHMVACYAYDACYDTCYDAL